MATFDSTQYALKPSQTSPSARDLRPDEIYGRERVAHADIPATVGLAQDDLVNLFDVVRAARCTLILVKHDAYGAGVTMDIGFAGDENALADGLDVAAAGTKIVIADNIATPLAARTAIQAAFKDANPSDTATASVTVTFIKD